MPQLVGLDRDGQPQPPPFCECILFDVTDRKSVALGLKRLAWHYGRHLAGFEHLAAYYNFTGEPHQFYEQATVEGTRALLRELRTQEFAVERFIFSSTMLVHEPGSPIDESSPLAPVWPYSQSKRETEHVIAEERNGYPMTMLRIAGVYTEVCDSIPLSHQIQRIRDRTLKSHFDAADTEVGQSAVHLQDTAGAIIAAIEPPEKTVYLIGEPETVGQGALQDRLGELLHGAENWTTLRMHAPLAKAGAAIQDAASDLPGVPEPFIKPWMIDQAGDHYELDISAARRVLHWEPKHSLMDTLPSMVEALMKDPQCWYSRHGLA